MKDRQTYRRMDRRMESVRRGMGLRRTLMEIDGRIWSLDAAAAAAIGIENYIRTMTL